MCNFACSFGTLFVNYRDMKKEKDMKEADNQEVENKTLEDVTPEPVVDTGNMAENVTENDEKSAKMADDWQDKYIRLSAEFDNFRKRTMREKMELIENGGADVLRAMLSTADDFDRALTHIADGADKDGVELIYQKFLTTLRSHGVVAMDLVGKPFDVDNAEAIAKFPAAEGQNAGDVINVAEKGYMIKDKVLRFAKVVVSE